MALLRICLAGLAAASVLALAACGNREPQERAAFISLLQSRLAAGTLVPIGALDAAEKKAVGRYDDAYDVIVDFQAALAKAAQPLRPILAGERIQSVDDIVRRREALQAARKTLAESAGAVQDAKARADKARGGLDLAPDLAPVYDGVYDEAVTAPAAEFLGAAAGMDTVARDALGVADFVAANAAGITLEDGQAKVATPSLQEALNLRLQGLNAQSQALEQARAVVSRAAAGEH
ncbi:DUF3053 family protein [Achromobacter ruhlandii]|uniref:DUF3053 domain-containing protein n=1 Tax=Achromobacter ruhlandii TaxID=72557 RepID=A0ABM8M5C9_9BURK|nr:DUF3053 family protein [Achromobacter ruhlandii]AKP89210.1 putative lipoprotein [Achromobacter xylosoxidans]AOU92042.1 DUF3053 superfamily protein [Achromobacter ruhlandii]MCZ8436430.1 DUF3053 family protein [Achromobacter ruhlandii]MDC6087220.1 DUF3053 family protein [Achromobacter ruhlandii]WIW04684.1 DUF3053 family protein [Achromobacter ruhlandii]